MAAEVAEPPAKEQIKNPVLPNDFSAAKSAFNQVRQDMGLDKPKEVSEEPNVIPDAVPPTKTDAEPSEQQQAPKPASVLPDDILNPPKEEPKVPEAVSEIDALQLQPNASKKSVAGFNELKTKAKEKIEAAEAKVRELEEKLSKSTSQSEIEKYQKKIEEAEKRAAEIEDQWAKISIETSPQFQRQFLNREKAELESAKSYLEGTEIDPSIVYHAARNHGVARVNILKNAGMDAETIAAVNAHLANYDGIQRDKNIEIENWRTNGAKRQEEALAAQQAEQQKRTEYENKTFQSSVKRLSEADLPFRISKDENWTATREKIISDANEAFNQKGRPMEEITEIFLRGYADKAGVKDKIITHLTEKNKELESTVARLQSAAPGGTITQANGALPKADESKMSDADRQKSTFNQEMAKVRGS